MTRINAIAALCPGCAARDKLAGRPAAGNCDQVWAQPEICAFATSFVTMCVWFFVALSAARVKFPKKYL
ncbi:hypothetical protein H2509_08380 [Stappia sp. F7233]|uniref:Uncharacterized protein n=1 Tax=Stappia albiluteola TaxID=2758565 RepID=A0A839ABR7_9HYPH|nr:hypothetical protein [Stappia albiluteola]MBA5777140.1 hypothetical protein [Stappia albiluteola]